MSPQEKAHRIDNLCTVVDLERLRIAMELLELITGLDGLESMEMDPAKRHLQKLKDLMDLRR